MGGVVSIPFYDIWGKALSPTVRGRFFSHRQFWGGILGEGCFAYCTGNGVNTGTTKVF